MFKLRFAVSAPPDLPRRLVALAPVVITLIGAAGCRQTGYAEQRVALRRAALGRTIGYAAERERRSPQRLARTWVTVTDDVRRDAQAPRANVRGPGRLWEDARERRVEQPARREELRRMLLRGKPDRIERVAVSLFF